MKKLKPYCLVAFFILLIPFYTSAEAGKGITDEAIILALLGLVIIVVNQIYLTVTSIKKFMNPDGKSHILHFISIAISFAIFIIYFPNRGSNSYALFEMAIAIPFILGIISLAITLYHFVKKQKAK